MVIYKCDKCGKELGLRKDLYRISAESEKYDDSEGWHCLRSRRHTKYWEVCDECEKSIMNLVIKQFDNTEMPLKSQETPCS